MHTLQLLCNHLVPYRVLKIAGCSVLVPFLVLAIQREKKLGGWGGGSAAS